MSSKPKDKKSIREIFKQSLLNVAKILCIEPYEVTRDIYIKTAISNNIVRLNKCELNNLGGYKVLVSTLFPKSSKESQLCKKNKEYPEVSRRDEILKSFRGYLDTHDNVPTLVEFEEFSGIEQRDVKKVFKSSKEIFQTLSDSDDTVNNLVLNESSFTKNYYTNLLERINKYNRFIVTTAVNNKKVNKKFLNSLKNYASRNDALILVLPCQDVASRKTTYEWNLDPELRDCGVIFKDIYLNDNLFISDIKVSAKQILPLTGLDRFTPEKGSVILASTKQFLKFIPNTHNKQPRCIMTSGAVTENDYESEFYMSKRLSKIASKDHVMGAIVVEIESDEIFHFRQLQSSDTGSIVDLGLEYREDGSVSNLEGTVAVFGDIHCGKQDSDVNQILKNIVSELDVQDIVLHDVFDCESVNHHHINRLAYRASKTMMGKSNLEKEGIQLADYLNDLATCIDGKLVVVESNHNEALGRYLEECRWVTDSENLYYSLDLMQKYIEGHNPLQYMIENKIGLDKDTEVKWLQLDEDYERYGIQLGCHGHLGANGAKGSPSSFENAYNRSVIGHRHSASIYRSVYTVGVSNFNMGYNKGLSSWTITLCLVYSNGCRQLVNCIKKHDGTYSWRV